MSFTKETKPSTSYTREPKQQAPITWDDADFIWDSYGFTKESKPTTTITKETKI